MASRVAAPYAKHARPGFMGSMARVRLRVLVPVVLALTLAACSSSQAVPPTTQSPVPSTTTVTSRTPLVPAVDLSATPAGWVPVAYWRCSGVRASDVLGPLSWPEPV